MINVRCEERFSVTGLVQAGLVKFSDPATPCKIIGITKLSPVLIFKVNSTPYNKINIRGN
jgi:preprotein translocase subunit Sec61beta